MPLSKPLEAERNFRLGVYNGVLINEAEAFFRHSAGPAFFLRISEGSVPSLGYVTVREQEYGPPGIGSGDV